MYQLHHGDCLEVMSAMDSNSVDMICTDIPYGVCNRADNGLRNLDKGSADIETFALAEFLAQVGRVTKGSVYIFCSSEQISEIRSTLIKQGFTTRICVWEKTNPSPMNGQHIWLSGVELCVYGKRRGGVFNEHCKNTVFRFPCGRNKLHPTQKPFELMERFICASSVPGQVVLDPCMGSGSTGVASVNTGRRFIGIELDPHYYAIAKERIEQAETTRRQAAGGE